MAAVAAALRPDDMAFLHYRDGAFQVMRSGQVPGVTPVRDMLCGFATVVDDPISGGRHKVLGSKVLMIPPQTSTIASHLPKAVGAAYSIGLARRHPPEHKVLADDSLIMCSFGDASVNHSTAQGAINAAAWAAFQSVPMPLMLVCEDNQIGISTRTPDGWIAANFGARPGLKYFHADGLDLFDTYKVAREAANMCAAGGGLHSCISRWSAFMATPVRTSSKAICPNPSMKHGKIMTAAAFGAAFGRGGCQHAGPVAGDL